MKSYYNSGEKPLLYYWRNTGGHEIDILVQHQHVHLPVEIKASKTITVSFFNGLIYWNELHKNSADRGFIVYGGTENQTWKKGQVLGWQSIAQIKNAANKFASE